MKKSTRYALVAPKSRCVVMDFGKNRELMDNYIADVEKRYGSKPNAEPRKLTTIVVDEDADTPDIRTELGITLFHSSSLVLADDNTISIHDRENDLFIAAGPATLATLNAIIDAAERLKVHVKK